MFGWASKTGALSVTGNPVWSDQTGGMHVFRTPLEQANSVQVSFDQRAQFDICFPSKTILFQKIGNGVTAATIEHLIWDQVLPRVIAHEGSLVLHAGGVVVGDTAISIMAPTGHGKSTLSASLHAAGNALLGDDALIVGDGSPPTVRAVYPSLRLLPDSVSHLFGDDAETRTMAHYSPKRHVNVTGTDATKALGMLIFLAPPSPDVSLRRLSVAETCMSLIANSFALDPTNKTWAIANMRRASTLAATVPAYTLHYPRDYAALPKVHTAICEGLQALRNPS